MVLDFGWVRAAVAAGLVAGLAAGLAACGGGGSSDVSPSRDEPGAAGPSAPVSGATCGLSDFAASALARVNQLRAAGADCGSAGSFGPAGPVAWNDLLTQAAAAHAQDMADKNYFSHTSQDGRTLSQRVDATGYVWNTLGENIAAGHTSVNGVVDAWMASPGHCANLMNPAFVDMGMACVPGAPSNAYQTYWAMELGRPR